MKSSVSILLAISLLAGIGACTTSAPEAKEVTKVYEPTWTSLRQYEPAAWLDEAKFGIYTHWGVWTIQYMEENKDKSLMELIELFNPVNFNPDAWAKLIKASGAKFAGPVAWHGSPYMHWDSEFSDTNSVAMNPHIDIVGDLEKAYRKAGLKFMMSYHYGIGMNENWISFAKEGVDKFSPDLFWVDAGFGGTKAGHHMGVLDNSKYTGEKELSHGALPERYQLEFISYYYNHAVAQDKEVAFIYKSHDIPPGVAIRDLENGLLNQIAYDTWMTDMDMCVPPDWETHGWFYREGVPLRTGNDIIDILVDVVSKNGILLLNVPPMADGTFSEETEDYLLEVGEWLKVNGEAIYGASPWFIFGEGPSEAPTGSYSMHHNNHFAQIKFSQEDIRFTVNGPNLYATCLGWPGENLTIKSLNSDYRLREGDLLSVSLLGCKEEISWTHTPEGLNIHLPEKAPGKHAFVFKIERQ